MWLREVSVGLAAVALIGCGRGGSSGVSGRVTFNGQPVPAGRVVISPDLTRGNDGPQAVVPIKDGRFDAAGAGPAGPVVVRVEGHEPPSAGHPEGRRLFEPYEMKADLLRKPSTLDVDVPAAAKPGVATRPGLVSP